MEGLDLGIPNVAREIDQTRENLRKADAPALVIHIRRSHCPGGLRSVISPYKVKPYYE
jgi:hypothetical protein